MKGGATVVVGYGQTPVTRAKAERNEPRLTADEYVAWAAELALESAGLTKRDIDHGGLGLIRPFWPHPMFHPVEMAENLGLSPRWLYMSDLGGVAPLHMLNQAGLAVRSGMVDVALVVAGDAPMSIGGLSLPVMEGKKREYELPFGVMGPNSAFGLIMRRHMYQYGTTVEQTGTIAVAQRYNASLNPQAIFRERVTMDDYLGSRPVADPIRLLDTVPVVNGGLAFLVTTAERAGKYTDKPVYLRGYGETSNYYRGSKTRPDITYTGITEASRIAYEAAGLGDLSRVDLFEPYDDYTIAVLMQLEDAGFCEKGKAGAFLEKNDLRVGGSLPTNTGGGQISSGQPGLGGGFVNVVESIRQLRGEGGERQVKGAKLCVTTGIGGTMQYGRNVGSTCAAVLSSEADPR